MAYHYFPPETSDFQISPKSIQLNWCRTRSNQFYSPTIEERGGGEQPRRKSREEINLQPTSRGKIQCWSSVASGYDLSPQSDIFQWVLANNGPHWWMEEVQCNRFLSLLVGPEKIEANGTRDVCERGPAFGYTELSLQEPFVPIHPNRDRKLWQYCTVTGKSA